MPSTDVRHKEEILQVAGRLFASLGYDGTSLRQIAEAAGVNLATIHYHLGGKQEVYLAVMRRAHRGERDAVEAAMAAFTPDRVSSPEDVVHAVHGIVDVYIDFCLENPETMALWVHRWLSDAANMSELERDYARPLLNEVIETAETLTRRGKLPVDIDMRFVVYAVVWCVHGFSTGGVLDEEGRHRRITDAAAVRRFHAFLHRMVHRTLCLPGDYSP